MRTPKTARPALEPLEGKLLLTGAHPALTTTTTPGIAHETYLATNLGMRLAESYIAPTGIGYGSQYTVTTHFNPKNTPPNAPNYTDVGNVFAQELVSLASGHGSIAAFDGFVIVDGSDNGFIRNESFHQNGNRVTLDMKYVSPAGYTFLEHYSLDAHRVGPGTPGATFGTLDAIEQFAQELATRAGGPPVLF